MPSSGLVRQNRPVPIAEAITVSLSLASICSEEDIIASSSACSLVVACIVGKECAAMPAFRMHSVQYCERMSSLENEKDAFGDFGRAEIQHNR